MFDFLKKKITNFVNSVVGKKEVEEKSEPKEEPASAPAVEEKPPVAEKIVEKKIIEEKPVEKSEEKIEVKEKIENKVFAEKVKQKKEEKIRPSLSIATTIKSIISKEIEIKKEDVKGMLDSLELDLIEADVDMDAAARIIAALQNKLVGKKVEKKSLNDFIKREIAATLAEAMTTGKEFNLLERIRSGPRPFVVVFLGINGSGKTTTMAKIAHLLMKNNLSVVFAAADTFRAAAIEQLNIHAERLGVKIIKRDYGSDPAAVAFDAINYARAHNIDVVLVDTAGRQETNANLMNELKKINRVIKPHLKIYVGESIGGSAVLEQVKSFNSEVGIDGIILTKIDCDAKGGTILSAANATNVPVLMLGSGQGYEDIENFDAEKIASRIME